MDQCFKFGGTNAISPCKKLIELNLFSNRSREGTRLLEGRGNDGGMIDVSRDFLQKGELETRKMEGRKKE